MSFPRRTLSRRSYLSIASTSLPVLTGCTGNGQTNDGQPTSTSSGQTGPETESETQIDATATTSPDELNALEAELGEISFDGKLFDTHVHWDLGGTKGQPSLTVDSLTARQEEHDVGATVLFADLRHFVNDHSGTVEKLTRDAVDYLPFMAPSTIEQFSQDGLESAYRGDEAVFHGVGEMAYYGGPLKGRAFDEGPMAGIFEFCANNGLTMMLHPTQMQIDGINRVLPQYPDTDFIFHGYQTVRKRRAGDTADTLLRNHDNLYWTYDVIEMTNGLFTELSSKEEFVDRFDTNRSRYLDRATTRLPELLDVAPDRIMWGTDVAVDWNMDPAVYRRSIELTWDVVDSLPVEHRDPYTHENALALFSG